MPDYDGKRVIELLKFMRSIHHKALHPRDLIEKYHLTCKGNADNFAIKQVNNQDESQYVKTDWSIEAVDRDSRCQTILSNKYSIQVIYVRNRRIIMDC